jgi:hypothetical protein
MERLWFEHSWEDWEHKANHATSVHKILQRMASMGYSTLAPYDENSLPTPTHRKCTLREYLMSLWSRMHDNITEAPFVFESVNKTDNGQVLITYLQQNTDEACTILDNLPLFIQYEMHLDPIFFLSIDCICLCQGNYYNPLTRTRITTVAQSLTDQWVIEPNTRMRIPQGIHHATPQELEKNIQAHWK